LCCKNVGADETYVKIKRTWTYLYRAIDSQGNTLEFLLSQTRFDEEVAERFFVKALHSTGCSVPQARPVQEQVAQPSAPADPTTTSVLRVINVDKNAAYPKAIADLKAAGLLAESVQLRQVKYLNNLIEQDHGVDREQGIAVLQEKNQWNEARNMQQAGRDKNGREQARTRVQGTEQEERSLRSRLLPKVPLSEGRNEANFNG
jgi:transposase-like protein